MMQNFIRKKLTGVYCIITRFCKKICKHVILYEKRHLSYHQMVNLFHKQSNKQNHLCNYHNDTCTNNYYHYCRNNNKIAPVGTPSVAITYGISPSKPSEENIQTQLQTTTNPVTTSSPVNAVSIASSQH